MGYILNVIIMYLLGALRSHIVCAHNVFTMCTLGIWVLAPSVSDLELCGRQEDLELLEFIRGAADSINDLD